MQNQRPLEFRGKGGEYFVLCIVTGIVSIIPFFGWAYAFHAMAKWMTEKTRINGQKVRYTATYGKTLGFVTAGFFLTLISIGIYAFWFAPKSYRFVMDHVEYIPDAPVVMDSIYSPTIEAPTDRIPTVSNLG